MSTLVSTMSRPVGLGAPADDILGAMLPCTCARLRSAAPRTNVITTPVEQWPVMKGGESRAMMSRSVADDAPGRSWFRYWDPDFLDGAGRWRIIVSTPAPRRPGPAEHAGEQPLARANGISPFVPTSRKSVSLSSSSSP